MDLRTTTIDWLELIPTDWRELKIKHLFRHRVEKVSDKVYPPLSVTMNGIVPQLENVAKSDNSNDRKKVCIGDFVINSRSDRKGSSGSSDYEGSVSLINTVLEPKGIESKYAEFLFKSKEFIEEFFRNGRGIHWDLWSTNYARMADIKVPVPPKDYQLKAIEYLESKLKSIDELTFQLEKKVELLKEKRTSLINQAVTKGLNPNVEMNDSGVDWIGYTPSHWELTKMKYGVNHISEKGMPEQGDIKISPENVESDTGICFDLYSLHENEGMKFKEGDILLNKLRLYLKKILITQYSGFSLGEMIVLRTNERLLNTFFYFQLFNQGLIDLLDSQSTGVKLPRVSPETILNTVVTYPPIEEQQQIIEFLDEQTQEIDKIIETEEERIDLLKEYRHSLISSVVTGKIKVTED